MWRLVAVLRGDGVLRRALCKMQRLVLGDVLQSDAPCTRWIAGGVLARTSTLTCVLIGQLSEQCGQNSVVVDRVIGTGKVPCTSLVGVPGALAEGS